MNDKIYAEMPLSDPSLTCFSGIFWQAVHRHARNSVAPEKNSTSKHQLHVPGFSLRKALNPKMGMYNAVLDGFKTD